MRPEDLNLDDIEAKARAATPGPWTNRHRYASCRNLVHTADRGRLLVAEAAGPAPDPRYAVQTANAAHIARMDPPTTLALCARIRAAEADAAHWKHTATSPENRAAMDLIHRAADRLQERGDELAAAEAKAATLEAESAALRAACDVARRWVAALLPLGPAGSVMARVNGEERARFDAEMVAAGAGAREDTGGGGDGPS